MSQPAISVHLLTCAGREAYLAETLASWRACDGGQVKAVELATRPYRLAVARAAVAAAKIELAAAVAEQDEAEDEVDEGYSALGDYVQDETNGDPVEIPTTGFGVASDNTAPVTLTAPVHFDVTTTEVEGQLHADWDAMRGARG